MKRWPLLLLAATAAAPAVEPGRWEGRAEVPGDAVLVVLDLTPAAVWLTLPGRAVTAQRLVVAEQGERSLRAAAEPAPGQAAEQALGVTLRAEGGTLAGTLQQGGHAAPLVLRRSGDVLPALPAAGPLPAAWAGVWRGRYDLGLGPRDVTLRISGQAASATIVGRRTTELAFDDAGRRGELVSLQANAAGLSIEAAAAPGADGTLQATLRQGPFEAPLVLRREAPP